MSRGAVPITALMLATVVLALYGLFWFMAPPPGPCQNLSKALPPDMIADLAGLEERSCETIAEGQTSARARIIIPAHHVQDVADYLVTHHGAEPMTFACCGEELMQSGQYDVPAEILPPRSNSAPALMFYLGVPWFDQDGAELPEGQRDGVLIIELIYV